METIVSQLPVSTHQSSEFFHKMEKAGFRPELAQRVIQSKNNEMAKRLVPFMSRGCQSPSEDEIGARQIMGKNFLGLEEVIEYLGITPTPEEWNQVSIIPYSKETLEEYRDSHFLFLGVSQDNLGNPLTIKRMAEMIPSARGQKIFCGRIAESYQCKKATTQTTPDLRWYLIKKSTTKESKGQPYDEQEKLLANTEYREKAVVYVYMTVLAFASRGETLFEKETVWCQDGYDGPNPSYHRIYVNKRQEGLERFRDIGIGFLEKDCCYPDVGLAPARKPDLLKE